MKKVLLVLSMIILACSCDLSAQGYSYFDENEEMQSSSDAFFYQDKVGKRSVSGDWGVMPLLPQTHGYHYDYPAHLVPVGSGLMLLAGMGVGYALVRRREKK